MPTFTISRTTPNFSSTDGNTVPIEVEIISITASTLACNLRDLLYSTKRRLSRQEMLLALKCTGEELDAAAYELASKGAAYYTGTVLNVR